MPKVKKEAVNIDAESRTKLLNKARLVQQSIGDVLLQGSFEDMKALKTELQEMIDLIDRN